MEWFIFRAQTERSNEGRSKGELGGEASQQSIEPGIGDHRPETIAPFRRTCKNPPLPRLTPSTNAPVFTEPAGKPFEDVLEALDAVE